METSGTGDSFRECRQLVTPDGVTRSGRRTERARHSTQVDVGATDQEDVPAHTADRKQIDEDCQLAQWKNRKIRPAIGMNR
nr:MULTISPECIES: hypothetical protein [unclassified Frankia]